VEYLHNKPRRRARTLFATHYHELQDLPNQLSRTRNYNVAVKETADEITFLYHIVPGGADRSYGIYAAQLAGMPRETLDRAKEILFQLECRKASPAELEGAGGGEPERADGGGLGSAEEINPCGVDASAENALALATRDVDVMQLDLFEPLVPPEIMQLGQLDVNRITPVQAMQILEQLVKQAKKWKL
jgi:DNA mismatch repair protein MutS